MKKSSSVQSWRVKRHVHIYNQRVNIIFLSEFFLNGSRWTTGRLYMNFQSRWIFFSFRICFIIFFLMKKLRLKFIVHWWWSKQKSVKKVLFQVGKKLTHLNWVEMAMQRKCKYSEAKNQTNVKHNLMAANCQTIYSTCCRYTRLISYRSSNHWDYSTQKGEISIQFISYLQPWLECWSSL